MKNLLTTAVLFSALVVSQPGRADCPFTKSSLKSVSALKSETVVKPSSYATPPEPFWHDLHWFE